MSPESRPESRRLIQSQVLSENRKTRVRVLYYQPLNISIPGRRSTSRMQYQYGVRSDGPRVLLPVALALAHLCGYANISVKATNVCGAATKNWESGRSSYCCIIYRNPPLTVRLHLPCSYQLKHPSISPFTFPSTSSLTACRDPFAFL